MYTTSAAIVAIAFCAMSLLLAFRWPDKLLGLIARILHPRRRAGSTFACLDRNCAVTQRWVRAWGISCVLGLAFCVTLNGSMFENQSSSVVEATASGFLATIGASLLILGLVALRYLVPWARDRNNLTRCGFRSLWVPELGANNRKLQEELRRRALGSKMVGCLDVTGYKYLGRGPGSSGGLLYDVLDAARHVPVLVLLFKPDRHEVDPERKLTSVFNNLLTEMELSESEFTGRVQSTLNAIGNLNRSRPAEAKIEVRYYTDKPTTGGILFDETAIMVPWHPREESSRLPMLEVESESEDPSFYQSFRRHFALLWNSPLPFGSFRFTSEKSGEVETPWKASKSFRRKRTLPTTTSTV